MQLYEGGLQRVPEIYWAYASLHYVIMFPRGEDGWYPFIPLRNDLPIVQQNDEIFEFSNNDEESESKYVTAMNYFAYRLQIRNPREPIILHRFG